MSHPAFGLQLSDRLRDLALFDLAELRDRTAHRNDANAPLTIRGTVVPQWAVDFDKPFAERIACEFEGDTIVGVRNRSDEPKLFATCRSAAS